MEDRREAYRQLVIRATHAAGGELKGFQPDLTLGECGIDTGIRLSAFFSSLCEGLVRAIPGFRPRAYETTFDAVSGSNTLASLENLILEVEAHPDGPPKAQVEPVAEAPAEAPEEPQERGGFASRLKGMFGRR